MNETSIAEIARQFAFEGEFAGVDPFRSSGNINSTFRIVCGEGGQARRYILQRINTYVFREPQRMMENIADVTEHLRRALIARGEDPARRVLQIVPPRAGGLLYTDPEGGCWRAYVCITDAFAYDTVDAAAFREVGRGFGHFQRMLCDYPADRLYESIPNFHNTTDRYAQLDEAIREDKARRVKQMQPEIDFLLSRREKLCEIVRLIETGALPLRVTHNDTKSNNVMLDRKTGRALCVIDLDTVMPGSALYDYGDAIRFGGSTAAEDEPDTGRIALDMEKTAAFTEGFVSETRDILTSGELRRLPLGIEVMTGELAVRFLTDYLNGDVYFKTNYTEHSMVRTRAQIALLQDIERREGELARMVDKLTGS